MRQVLGTNILQRVSTARSHNSRRLRRLPVVAALTESSDLGLGTTAPGFQLPDVLTGKVVRLEDFAGAPATLVMFICNHCPFVVLLKEALVKLADDYQLGRGVAVIAISSNSIQTHPKDGPEKMAEDAKQHGYPFPYLYDETQEVAKAYKAACTPEFYLFDQQMKLAYHGQFDGARPKNNVPVTGEDLRAALDDVLAGRPVGKPAKPSIGCNIKWHPGNEPNY
ncbi:hypothetical protein WJX72_012197 [[Myrmecia] bisecta]|uniref:Thioredoxin domain-containing protein n=1 Tax=[Myrmecia] bisecta TaxID=41462 RepID=A0AAW1R945_9CHLO